METSVESQRVVGTIYRLVSVLPFGWSEGCEVGALHEYRGMRSTSPSFVPVGYPDKVTHYPEGRNYTATWSYVEYVGPPGTTVAIPPVPRGEAAFDE